MKIVRDEEGVVKTETQIKKERKAGNEIKVTRSVLYKAKLLAKLELFKIFLIKFFDIRQFAYAIFTYELICKHKSPKRQEYIVLAKISRNATAEQVTGKLFTLKSPETDCTLKVVEVKLKPIGIIKKV